MQVSPVKEVQMGEMSPHHQEKQEAEEEEEEDNEEEEEEEDEGELALWSPDVQVLELQKDTGKGLGFSILDYQVTSRLQHTTMTSQHMTSQQSSNRSWKKRREMWRRSIRKRRRRQKRDRKGEMEKE